MQHDNNNYGPRKLIKRCIVEFYHLKLELIVGCNKEVATLYNVINVRLH